MKKKKQTSTKLLVIRCWYFCRTLASGTNLTTVASSISVSQLWAAQDIVWPIPSDMTLVVRYSAQQL